MVVREVVELRRLGFRFIALADDNFYPVPLSDLKAADRRADKARQPKPQVADGEDPDIAGIVPGPQRSPWDDDESA